MSDNNNEASMLRITGYSDKFSARPNEEVSFFVNSEFNEQYQVDIVRLIHGDTNLLCLALLRRPPEPPLTLGKVVDTKYFKY